MSAAQQAVDALAQYDRCATSGLGTNHTEDLLASALRATLAGAPSGRAAVVTSIRNATDLSKVEAEALAQHLEVDGVGLLPQ